MQIYLLVLELGVYLLLLTSPVQSLIVTTPVFSRVCQEYGRQDNDTFSPSSQPNGHMLILEPSEHVIFQTGHFVDGRKTSEPHFSGGPKVLGTPGTRIWVAQEMKHGG